MVDLLQHALPHHGDAIAERHGLDLIVRHVQRRHPERALELADLGAHLHAKLGVQIRERLVHEERGRVTDDRPSHRDPLTLTAGERSRLALEEVLEVEHARRLAHLPVDLSLLQSPQLEAEGDVVVDVQVGRARSSGTPSRCRGRVRERG